MSVCRRPASAPPDSTLPELARAEVLVPSAEELQALAARLARELAPGDFLALCGDLGSGKTCFVQGLARGLGVSGRVTSPTFVLLHLHPGTPPLCHLDAYRVGSAQELLDLGLEEYAETAVVAVEWADRVPEVIPGEALLLTFHWAPAGRRLELVGRGARPAALVRQLREAEHDPGV